jgi:hypothetical protein
MTKIVNVEAYSPSKEEYIPCEVEVDMEAYGVAGWMLRSVDGEPTEKYIAVIGQGIYPDHDWQKIGIDPITYDQVDAAARMQLLGES